MPRGYRCIVLAVVGWLILSASNPTLAKPDQGQEKSQPRAYPADAAPSAPPAQSANPDKPPSQPCIGAERGNLSCDAIAAKAAYDQARDADRQILIGWLQAGGLVLSLFFSALATRAAFKAVREAEKGAQAGLDSVVEAGRAADAARDQADLATTAYEALERPYIFVDIIADDIESDMDNAYSASCYKGKFAISIEYVIKNFGKTPAVITEISTTYAIWPDVPPDYRYASNFTSSDLILEAGGVRNDVCRSDLEYSREAFESLRECEVSAFFIGRIDYSDPTGARRFFTEFCWRYRAADEHRAAFISQAVCGDWNRRT